MRIYVLLIFVVTLPKYPQSQTYDFDFSDGLQEWQAGFADYTAGQDSMMQLQYAWKPLPLPLDTMKGSLFISGSNSSDDLFMFIYRKISGLNPNTSYLVSAEVEFASTYPTHAVGIGGAPGESVYMKFGVTRQMPDTLHTATGLGDYFVEINIDKGNQANPGTDMDTIGHVGVEDTTSVYVLKSNQNLSHPFAITTDHTGEGWLIIGTDSGFEGNTALYYNRISVTFDNTLASRDSKISQRPMVYPVPSNGILHFNPSEKMVNLRLYSAHGKMVMKLSAPPETLDLNLPPGLYYLVGQLKNGDHISQKIQIIR